ncbi:hypothetical protein EV360DRAFT_89199 [Lentinula raphanica]|nr:hypothetical protein EV360DRAFT_89199 [Lentinula raphanica]
MNSSPISISDDEDTKTSLTLSSFSDSSDLRRTLYVASMSPAQTAPVHVERPTCTPPVYESSAPSRRSGRNYKYYVVFVGDHPGCYRDWADASARVTNYPGNVHKGYDTYDQVLSAWCQHCLASHSHPPGFIDGTLFMAPAVPKTPPPLTPPPSKVNKTSFPTPTSVFSADESPIRTPSQIHPSSFPSIVSPIPTSAIPARVDSGTPQRRNHIWAIHSPKFNSVVPSSAQADKILMRAVQQGEEVEVRAVDGVAEAEEWFSSLSLDE